MFWYGDANNYYIGTSYTILSDAPNIDYVAYSGHRFKCADREVMRINYNGDVLIGTTTDNGYRLQVNGSERVYGNLIVDGEVSALVA